MTNYVGTDGNDVFSIGTGVNNVDGKAGNDLLILNLADVVGDLDTFNSGGVITNHLDGADSTSIGIGNIERVRITCGAGNDQLYLFGGDDTVYGGAGDDDINTRAGRGVIDGGSGFDIWRGDLSAFGEGGTLDLALTGKQAFYGGSVKAVEVLDLVLGSGDDTVLTLVGDAARGTNDTITAGAGDDVVRVGGGRDAVSGGDGEDLLIVDFSKALGDIDTFNSGGSVTNHLTGLDEASVGIGGFEHIDMTTGKGNDQIYLFNGDDTVSSGAGDDVINTRAGAAVVDGGIGFDAWIADLSAATDDGILDLASADQQAFLGGSVKGIESLQLTTGSGDDTILTLVGDAGRGTNDTIVAGAGDDIVRVGGGRDAVNGGEGEDLLIVDFSKAKGDIDTFNSGGSVTNHLTGLDEASVGIGGFEHIDMTTGKGNDEIYLFGGADTVSSGGGNDVINTRAGAAVVDGGVGLDTWLADLSFWTGGGVWDQAKAGAQAFYGGSVVGVESFNLVLGSGADTILTLMGKAGRGIGQTIDAGAGDDTIKVGGGRDAVDGGEGDDLLIIDFSQAKGNISSIHSGAIVSNDLTGADEFTAFIGAVERIDITTGRGADSLFTFGGNDTLDGGAGADEMAGHGGDDSYYVDDKGDRVIESAGQGTDTVYASINFSLEGLAVENAVLTGVGANRLAGNLLANELTGNDGDNVLTGAGAADLLTGGKGADVFDYNAVADSALAAADRITDLTAKDVIDLSGIDANTGKAGDQKFTLVDQFSGHAGELVLSFQSADGVTFLDGDVDGDGAADVRIVLDGDQRGFDHFVL